ncbi:diaminopimelate epimerase [Rhodospirillaceae bacterium SYSU D60014]|uniref:diaminopimelate epimerase n=1 Tax=Virgifigura deserti TaxID=2268457 RepID=UPI000E675788
MGALSFTKMHGLGNDFVVLDGRVRPLDLTAAQARAIADRKTGIGCDQLILLEPARNGADLRMRIRNADGGEVEACGNATRCVAALLMAERQTDRVTIETEAGLLTAEAAGADRIAVDMGPARLDWQEVPLAAAADTLHLDLAEGPLADPVAVNIGNPHAVFFVENAEAIDLARIGPVLERHPMFPARANIEVATVLSPTRIRMRVWERGAGITRACGTGACATLVAAVRRGLAERKAELRLDGGALEIEWLENGHVRMTGPAARSFAGRIDESLLAGGGHE